MRTYGKLHLDGDWVLEAVEPHVAIRLKQIFPRIPKAEGPPHRISSDPVSSADLDWFVQRYPLAMSEADRPSEASRIVDPSLGVQAVHSDYSHVQKLVQRYLDKRGRAAA